MDAEMIEKVARAIHAARPAFMPWQDEWEGTRDGFRRQAEAAIAALSATPQADPWHEAVVAACMRVDSCYDMIDPARTMLNLEKWWYELGKEHSPAALYVPALHGDFAAYMAAHQPATPQAAQVRNPDGYAYRYKDAWGTDRTVIKFNDGRELNGSPPLEAVPYYFGSPHEPQAAQVPEGARELIEQCRDALAEELGAWDIDPPLAHVKDAHDACEAWLAAAQAQGVGRG